MSTEFENSNLITSCDFSRKFCDFKGGSAEENF
jgi:hypothetical protein